MTIGMILWQTKNEIAEHKVDVGYKQKSDEHKMLSGILSDYIIAYRKSRPMHRDKVLALKTP